MKTLGKQVVSGLVMEVKRTKRDMGAMVNVQLMGGSPENIYVADEEQLTFKPGDLIEVACSYRPFSTGEISKTDKNGNPRTDRFPTFRQFVDIVADATALKKAA